MFQSESKKLTRRLLTLSLLLLALATLLMSPAPRTVHAEPCSQCFPLWTECYSWCNPLDNYEVCTLRCDIDYSVCIRLCDL